MRLVRTPLVNDDALNVGFEVNLYARSHLVAPPLLDGDVHPDALRRSRQRGPWRALVWSGSRRCRSTLASGWADGRDGQ